MNLNFPFNDIKTLVCFQVPNDVKAERASSPPAKRSRPADGTKRRVTFNPTVQEKSLQPDPKPVTLKEAADIVVRYLDPFYTQGKFATKVFTENQLKRELYVQT